MNVVVWIVVVGVQCVVARSGFNNDLPEKMDFSTQKEKNGVTVTTPREQDRKPALNFKMYYNGTSPRYRTIVQNQDETITKKNYVRNQSQNEVSKSQETNPVQVSSSTVSTTNSDYLTQSTTEEMLLTSEETRGSSQITRLMNENFKETKVNLPEVRNISAEKKLYVTTNEGTETTLTFETINSLETVTSGNTNLRVSCSTIPNITSITITPKDFNATLEWQRPNDLECVGSYIIEVSDGQSIAVNSNLTSYILESLNACSEYTVSIKAVGPDQTPGVPTEDVFNTTVPETFSQYEVQNLRAHIAEEGLEVQWEPPSPEVVSCVTSYHLVYWDSVENSQEGEQEFDASQLNTTLPIIGCMTYGIQIVPKAGESQEGKNKILDFSAEPYPANPPVVLDGSVRTGKNFTNVTWLTNNRNENKCKYEKIIMTCIASPERNHNFSWIVWSGHAELDIADNTTRRFIMSVEGLSPFTNYSCEGVVLNKAGNSSISSYLIRTNEDVPPAPESIEVANVTAREFTIKWAGLEEVPGLLKGYSLMIGNEGSQAIPGKECRNNVTNHHVDLEADVTTYVFKEAVPYFRYTVSVFGIDGAGNGTAAKASTITASTEPDSIVNLQIDPKYSNSETYHGNATIKFEPPCNTNGPLKHYEVSYIGTRKDFEDDSGSLTINETETSVDLRPDRNYTFIVTVVTENFTSAPISAAPFRSKAGVPLIGAAMEAPTVKYTEVTFALSESAFNDTNGEILAYALYLFTSEGNNSNYGFWNGTWPKPPQNSSQLTNNFWNPFQDTSKVLFTIGSDCGNSDYGNCSNTTLEKDTKYWLLVRAFTADAYKDSPLLRFQTVSEMLPTDSSLILGLIFGILFVIILIVFLVYLWRRKRKPDTEDEIKRRSTPAAPISGQKFLTYYASLKENPNIITNQFRDLGTQSKELGLTTGITFATLPENRRKNRYTNILPYDATRVTLKIDEDDEISSDYINASYIKGYSGKIEYIASQGPLASTTRDFWKMVLQENVTVIAMVSQFIEQTKEKCYQYFPNNHDSVFFGDSLEVKCLTELHFGTYCVRTLQVRKDREQRDVVHMQFLEWPDFGVPQGTDNMLQFCSQLREKVNKEGGLVVVHCSAGVGRTGTLIALDILFQTIDNHRDINIYKTVLDLRKQRTNMVQTEKQYLFIHACVKDYLEAPRINSSDTQSERIYENMEVVKSSMKKNLIETESAL